MRIGFGGLDFLMHILLQSGAKKPAFKTLKDFAKLNCLPLAMQACLPRGAEMLLGLGEGARPTERVGVCLTLLHPAPQTLTGFEATAISRRKMGCFYKQILNGLP